VIAVLILVLNGDFSVNVLCVLFLCTVLFISSRVSQLGTIADKTICVGDILATPV